MSNISSNALPYGTNQEFANNSVLIGNKVKKVKKPCYEHFQTNNIQKTTDNKMKLNNVRTISKREAYSNPLAWACYCKDNKCYCPLMH